MDRFHKIGIEPEWIIVPFDLYGQRAIHSSAADRMNVRHGWGGEAITDSHGTRQAQPFCFNGSSDADCVTESD